MGKAPKRIFIEYIDLRKLLRWPGNPKAHDEAAIEESFKRSGYVTPVILNEKTGRLIAGHGRLDTLEKLKASGAPAPERIELRKKNKAWLVPVIRGVSFKSDKDAIAFCLADNKSGELGGWEDEKLLKILNTLLEKDTEGLSGTGFNLKDQKKLTKELANLLAGEGKTDPDQVPLTPKKAKSRLGKMYKLGKHRLLCGDGALEKDVKFLMGKKKADLVFTDPPYGIDVVGNSPRLRESKKLGSIGCGVMAKTGYYKPILNDDTTDVAKKNIAIFKHVPKIIWGGNYFTEFLPPSRGWIVWDKRNGDTTFADCELAWTSFEKSVRLYSFLWSGMRRQGDRKSQGKLRYHPTQKPVGLLVSIINDWCEGFKIIIDSFLGSGSTLIACEKTNRICYGMEIDEHYCDVIRKRWAEFVHGEGCAWEKLTPETK